MRTIFVLTLLAMGLVMYSLTIHGGEVKSSDRVMRVLLPVVSEIKK